uniref:Uncharacterized protein n=1 Tax=Arundo donax TaxID=35708 RepID=A0A0A9BVN6_ARUDO
MVCAMQLQ